MSSMAGLGTKHFMAVAAAVATVASAGAADAQCPGRPDDPGGVVGFDYGSATVAEYDTPEGRVRVHYTEDGPDAPDLDTTPPHEAPDFVTLVGEVAEQSLDGYEALGFRAPVSDVSASCDSDGGDDRLDIYLVDFGAGDGQVVAGPCSGGACAGFALVDSRLAAYSSDVEGARTVVAHELFHVVQNAYVRDLDTWFSEGTAQWAADHLHPELTDLEAFLPAFFEESDRSIDTPPGGAAGAFLYATAVWPVFLEQRFDQDTVRSVLEAMATGQEIWPAHDAALASRSGSMATAFPEFAAWNGATGSRAGGFGYADAAAYPEVEIEELGSTLPMTHEGATSGFSSLYLHVNVGATPALASIDTDPGRNAGAVLRLVNGKAATGALLPMPATFDGEALLIVAGVSPQKPDGPFSVTVDVAPLDAGTTASAGTGDAAATGSGAGGGEGADGEGEEDDGCSCALPGRSRVGLGAANGGLLAALVAAALMRRRSRLPFSARRD